MTVGDEDNLAFGEAMPPGNAPYRGAPASFLQGRGDVSAANISFV
jgi:hypothetical protein